MPTHLINPVCFDSFRIDLGARQLLCGEQVVPLRPKAYDVLCYLASRPGEVVSIQDLTDACWAGLRIGPNSVSNVIYELRGVFAQNNPAASWIQTVTGHGYRFTAPLQAVPASPAGEALADAAQPVADHHLTPERGGGLFVGRNDELALLEHSWQQALRNLPATVFVSGEPGIGKTSLVQRFCARIAPAAVACIGRCIPQNGEPEPYMPVLEGLVAIASAVDLTAVARDQAPTWLMQMPWLVAKDERTALRQSLANAGAARMLREGKRLFVALAERSPLLLVLEDTHWADHATVDLIRALAELEVGARLMLIATYRPAEVVIFDHPMRNLISELPARRRHCRTVTLGSLTPRQVQEYLTLRFDDPTLAAQIAAPLEARSGGNPLFLEAMTNDLCDRKRIAAVDGGWALTTALAELDLGLPNGLREMIRARLRRLSREQLQLLQAASAAGMDFSTVELAAALERPAAEVEPDCEAMARDGELIRTVGEIAFPDGSIGGSYRFAHVAYREALADDTPPSRRRGLHRRIGECLAAAFGKRAREISPRLALHFDAAGEHQRQLDSLKLAVQLAAGRYAHFETLTYIDRILAVLPRLPPSDERAAMQIGWQVERSGLLMDWQGYAAAYDSYVQVIEPARQQGNTFLEFFGHLGVCMCGVMGSRHREQARREAGILLSLAAEHHPELEALANMLAACVADSFGELTAAVSYSEAALAALPRALMGIPRGVDLEAMIRVTLQSSLMRLGELERSRRERELAVRGIERHPGLLGKAQAFAFLACDALLLEEAPRALELAQRSIESSREGGFAHFLPAGEGAHAAARVALSQDHQIDEADLDRLAAAIEKRRSLDENWYNMLLAGYLADAYRRRGELERARAQIDSTFATAEIVYQAELWRIKAEIEMAAAAAGARRQRQAAHREAAQCFDQALALSRAQGSKLFEQRAAKARARLPVAR